MKPDHEAAMNLASKRHHRDPAIRNLARAYVEAVRELRRLDQLLGDMGQRIARVDTGPVSVSAYLDRPRPSKRRRRRTT